MLGGVEVRASLVEMALMLATEYGGWRRTMAEVRPEKLVKKPTSMALSQVEGTEG
jgi:hypothetical protein